VPGTSSTTVPETTTTEVSPTSVLAATTTVVDTTAAPTTVATVQTAQTTSALAFTGNNAGLSVVLGLGMIAAGAILISLERRRVRNSAD